MSNKNKVKLIVKLPAVNVEVISEEHRNHLQELTSSNDYSKVMSIILSKVMTNPNSFNPQQSNNQTLMQKQIKEIGRAIVYMGQQQGDIINNISNSNKLIYEMKETLETLTEYSNKQDDVIKRTFDLLSKSEEGLSILSKLKDTNIDLASIASEPKPQLSNNLNEKVKEVVEFQAPKQFISSSLFVSDGGDDDDLIGGNNLDEESRENLFTRFLDR